MFLSENDLQGSSNTIVPCPCSSSALLHVALVSLHSLSPLTALRDSMMQPHPQSVFESPSHAQFFGRA